MGNKLIIAIVYLSNRGSPMMGHKIERRQINKSLCDHLLPRTVGHTVVDSALKLTSPRSLDRPAAQERSARLYSSD